MIRPAGSDRWAIFLLVIGARVAITMQMQSVGAVGPAMLQDPVLGLSYTSLGSLIGAYMFLGIFVALPAGRLSARIGERRMVLSGLGLGVAGGLCMAVAPGFEVAFLGRLVSGAGSALLLVVLSAMLMTRFAGSALTPIMGTFLAANPLGIALALVMLPALAVVAGGFSWRVAMLVPALGCAVVLVAAAFLIVPREQGAVAGSAGGPLLAGRTLSKGEWTPLLAAAFAFAALNVGYIILLGFAPAMLTARGASVEVAGGLVSLVGWACALTLPFAGALIERSRQPLLAVAACLLGTALAVLALAGDVGPPAAWLLLAGLLTSAPATIILTLPARALAPEARAYGMGVYWTVFYVSMTALPPLAGWAGEATGIAAAPLVVAAMILSLAVGGVVTYGLSLHSSREGAAAMR
jgi:predicted MFS family arabinose efflux permease